MAIELASLQETPGILKKIRKSLGLRQTEAAEKMELTSVTVGSHEQGRGLNLDHLERYAKLYGVEIMVAVAIKKEDMQRLMDLAKE